MEKYIYAGLIVELTRKCNMKCPHCLRGDAQERTMTTEIIDRLIEDVDTCAYMVITGGEPLLEMDSLLYLLNSITNKWKILGLDITTNGTILDERIVEAFEAFCSVDPNRAVHFGISKDKYHTVNVHETAMNFYEPLVKEANKSISRKDLPDILKVSRATADRFWSEVSPKYITEDENGLLLTNSDIFIKGATSKGQSYRKMFLDGIRNLYRSVPASKHKVLGYVFQMLPFVNFEWNVLCYNPDETDLDSIDFMSIDEFRAAIGYEKTNISRLLKTYREIVFPVKGKPEPFCAFVSCGTSKNKDKIVVNPRILYSGTQPEAVRILGGLCKE